MLGNLFVFRFSCIHILCVLTAIFVFLSACSDNDSTSERFNTNNDRFNVPLAALVLKKEQDCASFKGYVVNSLVERHTHIPDYPFYSCSNDPIIASPGGINEPTSTDVAAAPNGEGASAPDGVSQTNNQEIGVNEGDIVKADKDGNLYILNGNHLIIADGFPPDTLSSKVVNLGAQGIHLYLDEVNHRVVVIARNQPPVYIAQPTLADSFAPSIWPGPQIDETIAIFFDILDPFNPQVIDQIHLKGYYQDSRRIDGRLHLISRYQNLPVILETDADFNRLKIEFLNTVRRARCVDASAVPVEDISSDPAVIVAKNNLAEKIRAAYSGVDVSDMLPTAFRSDGATTQTPISYLQCSDVYHPKLNMNYGLQVVTSVDTDGANVQATAIVNNTWMTYASQTHLYLAQTSRSWWWRWNDSPRSQTAIYKFAISNGKPEYKATGRVAGYVNNQFSFSEFEGALRVASTEDDFIVINDDSTSIRWQRDLKNRLTVLQDDSDGRLKVAGDVRNIAPGETIRSARFLGARGYIVTFRNIDPLFTFDLSDPSNPQLKGELELPGFSSYIHPYDADHLLTIGRSGGVGGIGTGNNLQLQLFDVSDLSHPKVVHQYTPDLPIGYSWSAAEYDHKAFTYYAPAKVLAIPMRIWPNSSAGIEPFSGIMAYEIDIDSGIKALGGVDHSDLARLYYCTDPSILTAPFVDGCTSGWYVEWAAPKRSVIMTSANDVYLYSVSEVGLKASNVYDLPNSLGFVLFPASPYPWWGVNWLAGTGSVTDPGILTTLN